MKILFLLTVFIISCGDKPGPKNLVFQAGDSGEYLNVKLFASELEISVGRIAKNAGNGIIGLKMMMPDTVRISWDYNGQRIEKIIPIKDCIPEEYVPARDDVVFVLKNGSEVSLAFDLRGKNFSKNRVQCETF